MSEFYKYSNIFINSDLISFILEQYRTHNFSYLVICRDPSIPIQDITKNETFYIESYTNPKQLNKLYNKISYYRALMKTEGKEKYKLNVYTITSRPNSNGEAIQQVRDVSAQMIALSKENDRIEMYI